MKNILNTLLIAGVILSLTCAPAIVNAMPEPAPVSQTEKQRIAEQKKKDAERRKKEQEKAKAQREKQKAADAKKREAEKKKAAAAKAAADKKAEQQKAAAKVQAEREKAAAERAKQASDRAEAQAKREADAKAKEEKALRDYEKYQQSLENPKTEVISYFNLGFRLGYAAMMDKINPMDNGSLWGAGTLNQNNALQQLIGGPGAGIDLTYNLEYGHFLFETGLDFRFLNSTSAYGFQAVRKDLTYGATYNYLFDNMREMRNMLEIGVPVMFGAQFSRYYFLLGAKIHYGLPMGYSQKGQYDITVNDPAMLEPYGMGIHDINGQTNNKMAFKQPDVSVAAEIGLDLDEWLQKQPDPKKKAKVKPGQRLPFGQEHIHYRVALFAEYGVLNTNNTPAALPVEFAADNIKVQKTNTMLAMNGDTKLNNLFVGAKFAIQFEVPGKKARPVPPPSSYAIYSIVDAETNEPLANATIETHNSENGKIALREKPIGVKGLRQKHALGAYTATVKADGYYDAMQSFDISEVGSTEYVTIVLHRIPEPPAPEPVIMPVEKGEVFIIKNLHFATNRTRILSSSEEALDGLYKHLADHPEIRIKIIGHTDNVGRDAANQKLSEGRANAVMKELIERGIAPERLQAEGRGESQPIDTNDTEEGRQNNRRVEIEIL